MDFYALLKLMVDNGASDLFITEGMAPSIKVNGKVIPVGKTKLTGETALELVESIMNDKQRVEYGETILPLKPMLLRVLASVSVPFISVITQVWCCGV